MLFSSLPTDIIHHILSYNETLKLRNGKYIGQIPLDDTRYVLLKTIPTFNVVCSDDGYCCTVYVRFSLSTRLHTIKMNIDYDRLNAQTRYCYRNLLYKEVKRHAHDSNVKFVESYCGKKL
jgi:hypothetical protein